MASESLACVLRRIHQLAETPAERQRSDAELLHCFLAQRDETAFRHLVHRHSRMVLNVCRQVLRQQEDAEDAFQATFLILARNAASIRKQGSLASWLHGVAYRTSLKARAEMSKRHHHEKQVAKSAAVPAERELALRELQAVLTEEVARLAEKYRAPFVLCCLEGISRSEAAQQLGWKEGTVSGRLAEARKRLQRRLERRGFTLSAVLCAAAVGTGAGVAAPPLLLRTTIHAALGIAAGQSVKGVVSAPVAALMEVATRALLVSKLKLVGLVLAAAGLVATAAGSHLHRALVISVQGEPAALSSAPAADKPAAPKPAENAKKNDTIVAQGRVLDPTKDMPITGRILTLEGRPVKGASIYVREVAGTPEGDLTSVLKSIQRDGNRVFAQALCDFSVETGSRLLTPVKTDEQGRFRFTGLGKERVVKLWVEGPNIEHNILYVLTRPNVNVKELVKSAPNRIGIPMALPAIYGPNFEHLAGPTKPITGIVRDRATGKPLADIHINGGIPNHWWENYVQVKTDKEGRYRILGLPKAGSYHVSAWGAQKGYIQVGKKIGGSEGLAPIALDFELVRGVRVRGRITDKTTGKPVPAALWYVPLEGNKHFDALPGKDDSLFAGTGHRNEKDGSYSVLALPGPGIIYVRAEVQDNPYTQAALDPADRSKAATTDPEEGVGVTFVGVGGESLLLWGHNAYRIIDPAPDAQSLKCDFFFDRGCTRTGSVLDPEGKPLTGVRVRGLASLGDSKTLAGSSFKAIALNPAQPRTICFLHQQRKLMGHIRLGGNEEEPVTVRLQPGAVLTGRVLDKDGKPFSGVRVHVAYRLNAGRGLVEDAAGDRPIQTDANGRFRIEGIFPDLKFRLDLWKGRDFFSTDEKYRELKWSAGTKDLGDIIAKQQR